MLNKHLSDLLRSEKFAIYQMRTMAKYYARSIPERLAFCEAFNRCETLEDALPIISEFLS